MKDLVAPIDKAGRVVLPKQVREELALNPGDRFQISVHGNEVRLSLKREATGFVRRKKALIFSSGTEDRLETDTVEAVKEKDAELSM